MESRRGRVLVVDDEPMVGSSIRRLLGRDHEVVVVQSGKEAVARIAAGERYDVVLCDLLMPEMTGMDVHADLHARDPELARRMVFLSGGAVTQRARDFYEQVPNPKLEKPFDVARLREIVQGFVERPR
ncbi:MAG TPA: response regulator [Myxococcales bacterium]|jgi:CheY-like chemotaxis protein|nr:response regulator [Myxococcales bacterium]HZX66004.1 response regulator [Myxococcales bacterium]